MIALEIADIKECMAHLLLKETFDHFLFISGSITTFNTFQIDGYLHKEFLDTLQSDALPAGTYYSLWKDLKSYCFSLMKGKKTPLEFKLVFGLAPANIEKVLQKESLSFSPEQVQGLYLNFHYDGKKLHCITGTSLKGFSMDKSLEHTWDHMAQVFFRRHEITAVV